MKILDLPAKEKGTYIVDVSALDAAFDEVVPDSLAWTLTTVDGTVINGRKAVSATPSTTTSITLSGDDLKILDDEKHREQVYRYVLTEIVYDSDEGDNLPAKEVVRFPLDNLTYLT
jgi:hypothetical protein